MPMFIAERERHALYYQGSSESQLLDSRLADFLPLHPPRPAPLQKLFHFLAAETIKVAWNGVFQTGRGHGKLESIAMARQHIQSIDQTASETVSAANPIHNVRDLVVAAHQKLIAVVQARRPAIV